MTGAELEREREYRVELRFSPLFLNHSRIETRSASTFVCTFGGRPRAALFIVGSSGVIWTSIPAYRQKKRSHREQVVNRTSNLK